MKNDALYQRLVDLAIQVNDELEAIDHNHLIPADTPKSEQIAAYDSAADYIHERYQLADKFIGPTAAHLDVAKGEAMILLGTLFNELTPTDKSKKGLLAYKDFKPWYEARGYKRQWTQDARNYARKPDECLGSPTVESPRSQNGATFLYLN